MKIKVFSDLHVEFHKQHAFNFIRSLCADDADVLCLAGDIGLEVDGSVDLAVGEFCGHYNHVVFVAGNHEFYNSSLECVAKAMAELESAFPNFHWLENSSIEIEGQRFIGCTLWFADSIKGRKYQRRLNDFNLIRDFRNWVFKANSKSRAYLRDNIQEGDVVLTHHIPLVEGIAPHYLGDPLTEFFLDQQPLDVLARPKIWCFGHTHESFDFEKYGTRFVCNPYGYYVSAPNINFDESKIIEI
tara:strand:- start:3779 stop:4507 length:729 start_codon:yes stop_codon:yes gene_type:complete